MKQIRTVKLKLNISPEIIQPTIQAYTDGYNHVCRIGWGDHDSNARSLHQKSYSTLRKSLPSQLAISARMKATESIKSVFARLEKKRKATCPQAKNCAIRYDARSYSVWFDRGEISFLTSQGRIKIPISVPEYFRQYLEWKRCSADLFVRKAQVFLHIVFEQEVPEPVPSGEVVGVDRGIKKLAVTSLNRFYGGGHIKNVSQHYENLRAKLQSKGSKSAKRHLKRLTQKENRFRKDVNHALAKQMIETINAGTILVLEDLKAIRETTKLRKRQRKELNKWNFYQLEQFLKYKAEGKGALLDYVDARYTSQKCHVCGYTSRSNRQHQSVFKCQKCSQNLNADLNAARNIESNYRDAKGYPGRAAVNQPIVALVEAKGSFGAIEAEGSYKPLTSGRGC